MGRTVCKTEEVLIMPLVTKEVWVVQCIKSEMFTMQCVLQGRGGTVSVYHAVCITREGWDGQCLLYSECITREGGTASVYYTVCI